MTATAVPPSAQAQAIPVSADNFVSALAKVAEQ
jgi:hypothetical protein